MSDQLTRCDWAKREIERDYHDREWGRAVHDEHTLFQMLILAGQAGGAELAHHAGPAGTPLPAFGNFDPHLMARYGGREVERLLQEDGVIKNRLKINAAIINARAYLKLCGDVGSLDQYLWSFVNHKPIRDAWERQQDIPAQHSLLR